MLSAEARGTPGPSRVPEATDYAPGSMRHDLLYRGLVLLDPPLSEPAQVELWLTDGAAVAFVGGGPEVVMREPTVGRTDDKRLLLEGRAGVSGDPLRWEGHRPNTVTGRWPATGITWADGTRYAGPAQVEWSEYGVTITSNEGAVLADMLGATAEQTGATRWVVADGGRERIWIENTAGRGCGCGGS